MDGTGERRRNNKRKRHFNKQRKGNEKKGYDDIIKENPNFETYYKSQRIVPENEWGSFMSVLKENLPVAFRITGSKNHAKALLRFIRSEYFDSMIKRNEDDDEGKFFCLPWYPENLAWQLNRSRKSIRKEESFTKLHNFLVHETNSGNISRQEVVSMIPPLLLDVQPHHRVLDMCAAPGSKTAQLIEMMHANDTALPDGIVVANDVDNKRCYMLVHQAKRLQSPSFIITNHDASSMPNIRMLQEDGKMCHLKYDRILCDVPCSGDGTLRKNCDVWQKWNVANGNSLHGLQLRIAKRGAELLAVGGRLVYSTCSFNPVEDEAVVHSLLVHCGGSLELLDVSSELPGLKVCPGLSTWKIMNRELQCFTNPDEVPEKNLTQIRPQMFPPKSEEAEKFHLDRCIRLLPHHQNTGGFFVAVFTKTAPLPGEKIDKVIDLKNFQATINIETNEVAKEKTDEALSEKVNETVKEDVEGPVDDQKSTSPPRKKQRIFGYKEDPFYFFKDDKTVWPSIKEFYKIDPMFDSNCLLTRCVTGKKSNIYVVTKMVKDIISHNQDRIKIINTGVKIFCRNDSKGENKCHFRLTQEGLQTILPFVNDRLVNVTKEDLVLLLTTDNVFNNDMSQNTSEQLHSLGTGCIVLLYKMELKSEDPLPLTIALCGWKGAKSTRAYVPKGDRIHYLRLCDADISKFEHSLKTGRRDNTNPEEQGKDSEVDEEKNNNEDGN